MAGRVDQVDRVDLARTLVHPGTGGGGGVNRDAALLFFFVKVHDGGAFMHFADFVDFAGVIEDALGDGGFARVDVGGDADISDFREVA